MSNRGIFKKSRHSETNQQYNSSKKRPHVQSIQGMESQQRNWIGDLNQSANTQMQDKRYYTQFIKLTQNSPQRFSKQSEHRSHSDRLNKSPTQLIQDILRGLGSNPNANLSPFYSKESEEAVIGLLTNKEKLKIFIKNLEARMSELDSNIVRNYQILILLLKQIQTSDVEVSQKQTGIEVKFNKSSIQKQELQIQALQRQLEEKDKQMKEVVEQYETVIRNFNDVIQKVVGQRESIKRASFQQQ